MSSPRLLYGFVDKCQPEDIKSIFGKRRIVVDFPEIRQAWCQGIPGEMIEIETLYGEYGGWVGVGENMAEMTGEDELHAVSRKKHPKWSKSRIDRAISQSIKSHKNKKVLDPKLQKSQEENLEALINSIHELLNSAKEIILVLIREDMTPISVHSERIIILENLSKKELLCMPTNIALKIVANKV